MSRARLTFRCPLCENVAAASSLRITGGSVEVCCAGCGSALRIAPYEAEAPTAIAPATEAVTSQAKPADVAPVAPAAATTTSPEIDTELLEALEHVASIPEFLASHYRRVVETGDRVEGHRGLLEIALAKGNLEQLGLIYRYRIERRPDDAVAIEMRDKLLAAAITTLAPPPDAEGPQHKAKRWATLGAAAFFILSMILAASVALRSGCLGL